MSNFIIQIIGGLVVAVLVSWLGIGRGKFSMKVVNHNIITKKTGKWIIIISVIIIIWGLMLFGSNVEPSSLGGGINFSKSNVTFGLGLLSFGVISLTIGKIIAWFQRP